MGFYAKLTPSIIKRGFVWLKCFPLYPLLNNYIICFCFIVGNDSQLSCLIYIITLNFGRELMPLNEYEILLGGVCLLSHIWVFSIRVSLEFVYSSYWFLDNRLWLKVSNQTHKKKKIQENQRGPEADTTIFNPSHKGIINVFTLFFFFPKKIKPFFYTIFSQLP